MRKFNRQCLYWTYRNDLCLEHQWQRNDLRINNLFFCNCQCRCNRHLHTDTYDDICSKMYYDLQFNLYQNRDSQCAACFNNHRPGISMFGICRQHIHSTFRSRILCMEYQRKRNNFRGSQCIYSFCYSWFIHLHFHADTNTLERILQYDKYKEC